MILDAILGFILAFPKMLLNSLSSFGDIVIPDGAFNWWYEVFDTLTYVFPVWSILPILGSAIVIKTCQIGYSIVLRIKNIFIGS